MKRKRARAAAIWAVAIILFGRTAHAAPITYEFAGTIDLTVLGDAFGTLSTGDTFQGVFTYDDATVVAPPFVPLGTAYNALTSFSMTIGGETLSGGAGAMVIHNDEGGIDFIEMLPFITFPAGSINPTRYLWRTGNLRRLLLDFSAGQHRDGLRRRVAPGKPFSCQLPAAGQQRRPLHRWRRFAERRIAADIAGSGSRAVGDSPAEYGSVRAGPRQTSLRLMRVAPWTSRAMIEQAVHPRRGHDGSDRLDSGAEVRPARPVGERQLHDCGDARRFGMTFVPQLAAPHVTGLSEKDATAQTVELFGRLPQR